MSAALKKQKKALLRDVFGFDSFRPGQEEMIDAILGGRDVVGIMPTGGGKSICYQLPALMLPGITLVISPLISLMVDQVQGLVQLGVRGAYLNSSLSQKQLAKALSNACSGMYKIIYLAPERLNTPGIQHLAECQPISMVCVDEAHCISQWGPDFRPSYLDIPAFVGGLPTRPVVAAFTATATPRVQEDIRIRLKLRDPLCTVTGFDRPNLYFQVQTPTDKFSALTAYLRRHAGQSGIIYCLTRREVETVHQRLCEAGFSAVRYHAGLDQEEKTKSQSDFIYDQVRLIVATNAFGMGIDKANVSFVLHYNLPRDIESYYQEAGRAGRNGKPADCILFYAQKDVRLNQFMIERSSGESAPDAKSRTALQNQEKLRLARMVRYATTTDCLGNTILNYFGEKRTEPCGHCSNCLAAERAHRVAEGTRAGARNTDGRGERLLSALYEERARQARRCGVSPDSIFNDTTLQEMAEKRPKNNFQLLQITGVTLSKSRKYGSAFLRVISNSK